jgi:hypothetical protein
MKFFEFFLKMASLAVFERNTITLEPDLVIDETPEVATKKI